MILLDTGPSERGWHRAESALRCPQLYRLKKAGRLSVSSPLVRGSIGHVGLAHLYAQWMNRPDRWCLKGSREDYYLPGEAMRLVADKFGILGTMLIDPVTALIREYARIHAHEGLEVQGIEEPIEGVIGGHRYTARVDLRVRMSDGKVWIMDHKVVGRIEAKVPLRYSQSGQVLGLYHLGSQLYGDEFGGVVLNLLDMNHQFRRVITTPPAPLLARFPDTIARAESIIIGIEATEALAASGNPPGHFCAPTPSEFTCMTPYGPCEATEICRTEDLPLGPLDTDSDL